jgi:AcrR family transcriptional regulator
MTARERIARQPERRTGRPRSARADAAILRAALELLLEDGYEGMTIEGVAERAGVGKATIYRRWDSKAELIAALLSSFNDESRVPDAGSVRGDLAAMVRDLQGRPGFEMLVPMIGRIISLAAANPAFMEILYRHHIAPRRRIVAQILQRGIERGELRADLDVDGVVNLFGGRIILGAVLGEVGPETLDELVVRTFDTLLRGIGVRDDPRP